MTTWAQFGKWFLSWWLMLFMQQGHVCKKLVWGTLVQQGWGTLDNLNIYHITWFIYIWHISLTICYITCHIAYVRQHMSCNTCHIAYEHQNISRLPSDYEWNDSVGKIWATIVFRRENRHQNVMLGLMNKGLCKLITMNTPNQCNWDKTTKSLLVSNVPHRAVQPTHTLGQVGTLEKLFCNRIFFTTIWSTSTWCSIGPLETLLCQPVEWTFNYWKNWPHNDQKFRKCTNVPRSSLL